MIHIIITYFARQAKFSYAIKSQEYQLNTKIVLLILLISRPYIEYKH